MRRRPKRVEAGGRVRLGKDVVLKAEPGARIVLQDGCSLGEGTRLHAIAGEISIGAGARLAERCTLVAHAGIAIGEGAILADGVMAVDFDHVTDDAEQPIRLQGVQATRVAIGARARLGPGVSVLRGVTVGEGATVGANSVVTRDVPPGAEAQGVPARPAASGAAAAARTAPAAPGAH